MIPLASARTAQEGGTGASQNPRRGGSLMQRNYRARDKLAAPRGGQSMSSGNLIIRPSCTSYRASIQSVMATAAGLR